MRDFTYPLGNAIRNARKDLGYTQSQVASMIDVDVRTIMNIENYKGNPKMEVLYPLIKVLKIDPRVIFNHDMYNNSTSFRLQLLLDECSEQETALLYPIINSIINAMRSSQSIPIDKNI